MDFNSLLFLYFPPISQTFRHKYNKSSRVVKAFPINIWWQVVRLSGKGSKHSPYVVHRMEAPTRNGRFHYLQELLTHDESMMVFFFYSKECGVTVAIALSDMHQCKVKKVRKRPRNNRDFVKWWVICCVCLYYIYIYI